MSDELSRKILKRPDVVLEHLKKGYQWGQENLKTVLTMCVVLFVALAVGIALDQWQKSKEEDSLSAFYQIESGTEQKGISAFQQVIQKHPKSKGAHLAYLKLGELYSEQKKWKEAADVYEAALKLSRDRFYRLLGYYNLGYIHEMAGECDKAVSYFQKITGIKKTRILLWTFGSRPNAFWLSSAYFGIGRCYEKLSRLAEAKETYLRVADEFPDTAYADKARAYARQVPMVQSE